MNKIKINIDRISKLYYNCFMEKLMGQTKNRLLLNLSDAVVPVSLMGRSPARVVAQPWYLRKTGGKVRKAGLPYFKSVQEET